MSSEQNDLQLVQKHVAELGEHFDAVQIFAIRHEPELENGTVSVACGAGSWFTRYGKVAEWMIRQDETTRVDARKDSDA